ncbi:MAG TPA: serine hydrolase [Capillimicrobium sp.]
MPRTLRPLAVAAAVALAFAAPAALAQDDAPPNAVSAVAVPAGQIDAAVAQLDGIATDALARSGVPGMAIAVVHDDRVVYAKGFGTRRVGADEPVDADTVFQIASLSKSLAATVVAREVGEGTVAWDDRMAERLPWFRLKDRAATRGLMIADLFSHRSGLPDHIGDDLEDLGFGRRAILERLRFAPLTPIRSHYAYTNYGITAGAEAVARTAGTDWATLSERALYRPAGMTRTSSRYADYEARSNRAVLHVERDGRWQPLFTRDADAQSPAGGVSSSVNDLARWLRLQLGEGVLDGQRLVAADALLETHTPHILSAPPATPSARPGFYGLAANLSADSAGRTRISHSGAFLAGAGTTYTMLPSEDLGIVVLTNGQPEGVAEAVAATFMDLAELGRVERDWLAAYQGAFAPLYVNPSRLEGKTRPADPRPARPLARLAGRYANGYVGAARVTAAGGKLVLRLGPGGEQRFELTHFSGDRFSYEPTGENALGLAEVRFSGGGDGPARAVTIEPFSAYGLGTLRRR